MNSEVIVELTDMTFGGDALGRLPDGRAVFVPFGLPQETVKIRLTNEKATFARGEIVEILQTSPLRIQPLCPHFGICGGCNDQHLAYADQLIWKRKIVVDQLKRLAGLPDFPVASVVASPNPWNYRNTLQFHVSPAGKLSFQRANSNDFVEIRECHLPSENINCFWPQISFEPDSNIDRVVIREGLEDDMILGLESRQDLPPEFSVDFPISVVYSSSPENRTVLSGDEFVLMEVNGRTFKVSIGSFFQVNLPQAEAMVKQVLHLAGDLKDKVVLDGYCGVGLFSAFMAGQARQLIGIEFSQSACDDYAANLDEFANVELYIGQVEQILPGLAVQPEIVVIDPPRAGLDQRVIDAIAKIQPEKVIYVSCDPATLARDVKRFQVKGYSLQNATPFDQFPQTSHIETIALITRE